MASHNDLGKTGEDIAQKYLIKNGYEILEINWKYLKNEIDIIAKKGNIISFVEVKTRVTKAFGAPELAVSRKKQKNIITAAQNYLENLNEDAEARFDVISIIKSRNQEEINFIKEAFYPLI